ncbi:HNH endonuclease [Xanthomonas campestris pv. campestris]|uniref:HNH endonuclease n=1 Tax=Xanthomonas campestris TaxID=339 RepID=UPI0021639047|nr:HNH endonuclease [Xanthomonas campestris]MDC8744699.1 HNH endonuclease [Xanthomonas campestris]MDO0862035.1 HNH endonuclease [Xanthomonas campestris pv. campestris]MEA9511847.1 HNH endonuclease [Xanthomonas campestris]MEA9520997.1 HNH endonuclease [Xanthomonas campestris]MEA9525323.1 HNH endonuclease [Xanthomonas campestris]
MSDAFRRYGVEIKDPQFNSSALSENPRQVILSLWSHNFSPDMSRYAMETVHWKGSGKHTFRAHLEQALAENLPIRVVVATSDNPTEVRAGNAARASNDFVPNFSLVGQVVLLEANSFELAFERTGELSEREVVLRDRATVKYWHVAEAVQALAKPSSTAEIRGWLEGRYPGEDHSDLGANLSFLTVNDTNRRYYDKTRKDWRSSSNHPRDLLFRRGKSRGVTYEPFRASIHGHWTLQPNDGGVWEAVQLAATAQSTAEAEGQDAAFAHLPPLDSDHDARVWAMRAVAQRRGQSFFRNQLLDAYGSRCAITGCSAKEVLEAAHILPYRGDHTDRVDNGLLLRADLHTLFDCLLLWITPENKVALASSLLTTDYLPLKGQTVRQPESKKNHPNPHHLREHARRCQELDGAPSP